MGKRVRVSASDNDWTKYSYTSSSIEKRTGLTRREIEQMRREAREETSENPFKREDDIWGIEREIEQPGEKKGINLGKGNGSPVERVTKIDTPVSVEWGTEGIEKVSLNTPFGSVAYGPEDGVEGSISALGFGVEKKEGGGKIKLPGGISIDFVEKGCYVVEVYRMFGQYTHSNIQKKPNCDDDDGGDTGNDGSVGGGQETNPPHCIGNDGNVGGGDAGNQIPLPPCIPPNKRFTFRYAINTATDNIAYDIFTNNPQGGFTVRSKRWGREPTTNQFGGHGSFAGTIGEFQEFLKNNRYPRTLKIGSRITKQWVTAQVIDPSYANCNPTGNEGCFTGSSSSIGNGGGNNPTNPPAFPKPRGGGKPPGKGNEDDDMSCCSDNQEILKLILDAVGYHLSPIEVPKSLVDDEGEGKESVVIPNISSFVIWWFGRWDEIMGKYPQEINIEDFDPLTKGKQTKKLQLSNQAESMADIYSQVVTLLVQQQIQLDMMYRTMLTTGLNRESGIRNEEMLDAIIDYMGFNIKEQQSKVKQLFTPGKTNWDELLQESESTTKTVEIDTDSNLQVQLTELLQAAAITRAVHFNRVNPKGNISLDLKKTLLDNLGLADKIKNILGNDRDWEDFVNWIKVKYPDSDVTEKDVNSFDRS